MQYFPPALENLVEQFAKLPGVGIKSAQRLAFYVLSMPQEDANAFAQAIVSAKSVIHCCPVCQNLTEGDGPCSSAPVPAGIPPPLRGGRSQGRGGHGALPGIPGALPRPPRSHLADEPRGAR